MKQIRINRIKNNVYEGQVFGYLTVIEETERRVLPSGKLERMIKCKCKCGKEVIAFLNNLIRRPNYSCGCEKGDSGKNFYKHGLSGHPIYKIWASMMERCSDNPNSDKYKYYYSDGVRVCNEWASDFMTFYDWAIDKWKKGLVLDKDKIYRLKYGENTTGKLYCPEYCSFITPLENCNNRRTTVLFDYKGRRATIPEIAKENNLLWSTLYRRLMLYGMSMSEAISQTDYRSKRRKVWNKNSGKNGHT
jgi:hypothetical protein